MTMEILGINLEVQCADGSIHQGVRLAVEDNRRIYLADDGSEIDGVETVVQCTLVRHPMIAAAKLLRCKECD